MGAPATTPGGSQGGNSNQNLNQIVSSRLFLHKAMELDADIVGVQNRLLLQVIWANRAALGCGGYEATTLQD